MSRHEPSVPWRVVAFSLLLIASLALAWWLAIGRDSGEVPARGGSPGAGAAVWVPAETPRPPDEGAGGVSALDDAARSQPGTDPEAPGPTSPEPPESLHDAARRRAAEGTMLVQLYLVVPGLDRLIPVAHEVEAPPTLEAQAQRALEELVAWTGGEMISPLPPEASVREVWLSPAGIAYVDFDAALRTALQAGTLGEIHAVYGVVHTITSSFPEIRAVQILVDAEEVDTLAGHLDLSRPLLPSSEWVIDSVRARPAGH